MRGPRSENLYYVAAAAAAETVRFPLLSLGEFWREAGPVVGRDQANFLLELLGAAWGPLSGPLAPASSCECSCINFLSSQLWTAPTGKQANRPTAKVKAVNSNQRERPSFCPARGKAFASYITSWRPFAPGSHLPSCRPSCDLAAISYIEIVFCLFSLTDLTKQLGGGALFVVPPLPVGFRPFGLAFHFFAPPPSCPFSWPSQGPGHLSPAAPLEPSS